MASHLTTQQVTTQKNIDAYLNSIGTVPTQSGFRNRNVAVRIENAVNSLANINDRIEAATDASRREKLETERSKLYDNIKKISDDLDRLERTLSTQETLQLLSPTAATDAASLQRSAVLRQNLKNQAEAANAEQASQVRQQEFEEQDLTDIQVVRSAYQHYLLYNADFFAEYHREQLLQTTTANQGYKPLANDVIQTEGYVKRDGDPRVFLLSDDVESTIVNNKLSFCPGNERFVDITTAEYAYLQPLLRIYKVYRNKDGEGTTTGNKKVELEFRNRTGLEGINEFLNIARPVGGALDKQRSRGVECGVKSFDWTFIGSDPFTATRDIEATLVLHAQHFSTLSQDRTGKNLLSNSDESISYKLLDLIIQPDCSEPANKVTRKQPYNGYYNPGCYEIQIDVGYAPQTGDLQEAICCQYDSLYLVHVDHKIDFKDDGTLDLTISYRGRLETIVNDKKFNVLLPGGGFASLDAEKNQTGKLINIYNKLEKDLKDARKKDDQKTIKGLERERAALFVDLRQYTYALILEIMEDKKMIHSIEIENSHFLRFARWKEPKFRGTLPEKLDRSNFGDIDAGENNVAVQFREALSLAKSDPDADAVSKTLEEIEEQTANQIAQRLTDAVKARKYKINFVYLGDLLAIVLANTLGQLEIPANITSKTGNDYFRFIGEQTVQEASSKTIEFPKNILDPITKNFHMVLGNIDITESNGASKQVNLAHIPISLESFQDFMMKNVISQNSDYYSLTDFIDDLIGDLVTDMFSDEHHVGLIEADSRLSTTLYTSKTPLQTSNIFEVTDRDAGPKYKQVNTRKIDSDNLPFGKDSRCVDRQNDPYQYLVINTLNSFPSNLAGDYLGDQNRGDNIGDKNRGIMHFTYGRDRGLLKSVQFSKTDQEFFPEARFSGGDGSLLNQLSNVYDATFNMIGNNMFKPGMLIYFNPEPMGVGSPWQLATDSDGNATLRSWANIMGIGGYHLITEVAHSIGPGKFDTSIKARWVNSGQNKIPRPPQEEDLSVDGIATVGASFSLD